MHCTDGHDEEKMCVIIHAIRPQRLCTGNCIGMQNLRKMLPAATSPPPTHGVWAWIGKVIIIHSAGVENHLSYLSKQLNCSEYSLIPMALGASLCLYRKAYVTQRVTSQTISRPEPERMQPEMQRTVPRRTLGLGRDEPFWAVKCCIRT